MNDNATGKFPLKAHTVLCTGTIVPTCVYVCGPSLCGSRANLHPVRCYPTFPCKVTHIVCVTHPEGCHILRPQTRLPVKDRESGSI